MSSVAPELASQTRRLASLRLLFWIRLLLAALALGTLLGGPVWMTALLLVALLALLLIRPPRLSIPAALPPAAPLPLIEDVTRQLSTSLSIGQVANIVLGAALHVTGAETAVLAMPVEVDHFLAIMLQPGQSQVQMEHREYTGDSLIEQVLKQERTIFSRQHSGVAVLLRHEYLVIGVLSVENPQQIFTQTEADLLSEIAVPAAISLHNAHLLDEQQYQIDTLSHIQALTLRLAGAVDASSVAWAVLETTRDILGVQEVALYHCVGERLEAILSLHRDQFNDNPRQKRLSWATALKTAQTGKLQIARQPVICVAVPVTRGGAITEVLAAAFIEHHTLRHRDLNTLSLLASQTAAHLDTVELHQQIRAVSDHLRVTINSARDGVVLLDSEGRLAECNPSAERLLGIDKDMFLGKHFVAMLVSLMEANELNGLGYSRSQLTELTRQLRLEPKRITRRQFAQVIGGQKVFIEEIGSPVIDTDNQVIGRLLVLRDNTEEKLLADFRDEITHMAVHDLRGPLTAIINGIDMTLKLGLEEAPEDNARVLRLSLESARALMRIVDSLLDIAKLENRRMPIKAQSVIINQLIASVRQTLANSIQEADIQLDTALPDDLPLLNVDLDLIRRVLVNLLDNALRFTPQGEKILIEAEQDSHQQVVIRISDSGPGIPPEERELIFEQYRQSTNHKPLRGSKGTGLGLTFCQLAVEAHGGRIWVEESRTLSGACFAVSLPTAT
jgi:PAS domain S-box-containing protein